jgi:DNA replication protein
MKHLTWFDQTYFNPQAWLLENMQILQLNSDEILILLLIIHFQTHHISYDLNKLAHYSNLSIKNVDKIISKLIKKSYFSLQVLPDSLSFDLKNLYNYASTENKPQPNHILSIFEHEFKRPLSASEVDKIEDWLSKVPEDYLIHALREAIIYKKLNFGYIDKILLTWIHRNISLEQLNSGQRNG